MKITFGRLRIFGTHFRFLKKVKKVQQLGFHFFYFQNIIKNTTHTEACFYVC